MNIERINFSPEILNLIWNHVYNVKKIELCKNLVKKITFASQAVCFVENNILLNLSFQFGGKNKTLFLVVNFFYLQFFY